jgi:hypothetical protein
MTTPVALPAALRCRLAALARRVRTVRLIRAAAGLVVLLALAFPALYLADSWLYLLDEALGIALAALLAL